MRSKNKKSSLSVTFFRNLVVGLFVLFLVFVAYDRAIFLLRNSDYFTIKNILVHPSLRFIESDKMLYVKGKNLFEVDLKKIQNQLQLQYPYVSHLRVIRRLPDQIFIMARERAPFAQMKVGGKNVVVDEEGSVVLTTEIPAAALPWIAGISPPKVRLTIGSVIKNREVQIALGIIKTFYTNRDLLRYQILKIDVSNLSEINFFITDDLKIIMGQEAVNYKLTILGLLLSQAKAELGDVKYIDLRFKEPILGKK